VPQRPFLIGSPGWVRSRLGAVQRLDLALFIDTENNCLLRRVQVQTDDIGHLLQKLWIARQFECLRAMWLQLVSAPDIIDRRFADPLTLCHGPATPVRHPCRFGLQGRIHNGRDLVDFINRLPSPTRSNIPQTVKAFGGETLPPQIHRVPAHRKLLGNRDVGLPRRGRHNDPAAQSHLLWRSMRRDPLPKLFPVYSRNLARFAHAQG